MSNRCQAIKGTDERADEYIICGAIAPNNDTRGPVEAHLCQAHHELFMTGGEIKIAMGPIGHHGIIGRKLE